MGGTDSPPVVSVVAVTAHGVEFLTTLTSVLICCSSLRFSLVFVDVNVVSDVVVCRLA